MTDSRYEERLFLFLAYRGENESRDASPRMVAVRTYLENTSDRGQDPIYDALATLELECRALRIESDFCSTTFYAYEKG